MKYLLRPATWLLSQLTFPRKLALVGVLFLIPLALLAILLLPRLNADIAFAERELVGIQAIKPIKILTAQAQAHRGTVQLILNGDQDARERLADIQANAEAAIAILDDFDRRHGARLNTSGNWKEIKFKWNYLQDKSLTLPADKDFLLYTDFISCLNAFLNKLADSSSLSLDYELAPHYVGRVMVARLPELIESLGQIRAMSAAAAERKTLSASERHQLSVLVGEAEISEKNMLVEISKAFSAFPSLRDRLNIPLQEVSKTAQFFIFDVQNEVLLAEKITAGGQTLFDAGTLAINASYRLCDSTLPLLQGMIQERLNRLLTERRLIFTLTAIALTLVAYLFIGFSVSVLGNLTALKEAASRVAKGDFHAYASIATRDEMHDIASSFNRMTDSLRSTVSQLRTSEEKYHKIMEQAGDMILLADLQGKLVDANRMAETLLGYSREELLQMNILDLTPDQEKGRAAAALARLMLEGICEEEHLALRKDGRTIPVHAKCTLIEHAGEKLALGIFRDISAARESRQRIEFLATHDPLTSLPTRSLLYDRVQQALARSEREPEPFALIFIDLDNFKAVNDTFGHDQGDQLLLQAATRIQNCLRAADTAARLGGDEFTVLVAGADRETAAATAQRIVDELALP
ncbi:MAG: diguanylate cyclase, partial [Sulfuricella sp.]|nr:diguanylate cyclase [Sulfuricella sp.]